jgi:hypothetical protein
LADTLVRNLNFIFYPIEWSEFDQSSNAKLFQQSKKILKLINPFVPRISGNKSIPSKQNFEYSLVSQKNGKLDK